MNRFIMKTIPIKKTEITELKKAKAQGLTAYLLYIKKLNKQAKDKQK